MSATMVTSINVPIAMYRLLLLVVVLLGLLAACRNVSDECATIEEVLAIYNSRASTCEGPAYVVDLVKCEVPQCSNGTVASMVSCLEQQNPCSEDARERVSDCIGWLNEPGCRLSAKVLETMELRDGGAESDGGEAGDGGDGDDGGDGGPDDSGLPRIDEVPAVLAESRFEVAGDPLEGVLHVLVLDYETLQPAAGARVFVSRADGSLALQSPVNEAGRVSFRSRGLKGGVVDVTAISKDGNAIASVFGVNLSGVTLVLESRFVWVNRRPEPFGTRTFLDGEVSGFENVDGESGEFRGAVVGATGEYYLLLPWYADRIVLDDVVDFGEENQFRIATSPGSQVAYATGFAVDNGPGCIRPKYSGHGQAAVVLADDYLNQGATIRLGVRALQRLVIRVPELPDFTDAVRVKVFGNLKDGRVLPFPAFYWIGEDRFAGPVPPLDGVVLESIDVLVNATTRYDCSLSCDGLDAIGCEVPSDGTFVLYRGLPMEAELDLRSKRFLERPSLKAEGDVLVVSDSGTFARGKLEQVGAERKWTYYVLNGRKSISLAHHPGLEEFARGRYFWYHYMLTADGMGEDPMPLRLSTLEQMTNRWVEGFRSITLE